MKLGSKIKNILNELSELMNRMFTEFAAGAVRAMEPWQQWGTISAVDAGALEISGLQTVAKMGDRLRIEGDTGGNAEVVAIRDSHVVAMPDGTVKGMSPGDKVYLCTEDRIFPSQSWLGNVIASDGTLFDGAPAPSGEISVPLNPPSIKATARRGLGERLNTGLALFDTFLPLCRGQRVGLFAGSGVGKSTLIGNLAKGVDADIVIIALIGERSREVGEFVRDVLGEEGMKRSIVFASTCDEPAPSKRRTAYLAMAAAEYFRDQGLHVLLLFDSITRFADAHREIALIAGETPSLRAYPPSTFRAIAELAERPGPGTGGSGDITAVFTVLVAGSDMDEPVADAVRGILDGHVVMEREIAERGRYPAVNVRKSVSRCLPKAASDDENQLLIEARQVLAAYEEAAPMIRAGLYAQGSDPAIDRAIQLWPVLDAFITLQTQNCEQSYSQLASVLRPAPGPAANGAPVTARPQAQQQAHA